MPPGLLQQLVRLPVRAKGHGPVAGAEALDHVQGVAADRSGGPEDGDSFGQGCVTIGDAVREGKRVGRGGMVEVAATAPPATRPVRSRFRPRSNRRSRHVHPQDGTSTLRNVLSRYPLPTLTAWTPPPALGGEMAVAAEDPADVGEPEQHLPDATASEDTP